MKYIALVFFLALSMVPLSGISESLLTPEKFPETFDDIDFETKLEFEENAYAPFANLNAYQQLTLIYNDQQAVEEIVALENEDEVYYNEIHELPATQYTTNPEFDTFSSTSSSSGSVGAYCANKSPNIPENQAVPLGWPADDKKIASRYGWRKMGKVDDFHHGVDLAYGLKNLGKPVYATANGTVIKIVHAGGNKASGNFISIKHGNTGFTTQYMHLDTILVKKGDIIKAGCQIGTVGHTGGAKAAKVRYLKPEQTHLHYGIIYSGKESVQIDGQVLPTKHQCWQECDKNRDKSVDPVPFLNFKR